MEDLKITIKTGSEKTETTIVQAAPMRNHATNGSSRGSRSSYQKQRLLHQQQQAMMKTNTSL